MSDASPTVTHMPIDPGVIEGITPVGAPPGVKTDVIPVSSDPFAPAALPEIGPDPTTPSNTTIPATPIKTPAPNPVATPPSATDILATIPPIAEMQLQLKGSGMLVPELRVESVPVTDTSPLAALQPDRLKEGPVSFTTPPTGDGSPKLPDFQFKNTTPQPVAEPVPGDQAPGIPLYLFLGMALLVESVIGIIQLIHFIVVKYPRLEGMLVMGQILPTQVNVNVISAVGLGFLMILTLVLAITFFIQNAKVSTILLFSSIALLGLNILVQNRLLGETFSSGNPMAIPATIREISTQLRMPNGDSTQYNQPDAIDSVPSL